MEVRSFGARGLMVSRLGFGGASLSGAYGDRDDDNAARVLAAAVERDITYFDTSDAYGNGRILLKLRESLGNSICYLDGSKTVSISKI